MVRAAIALRGHDDCPVVIAGDRTLDEEDVGFLTGLEHAELGVDGGVVDNEPVGPRLRSA